MDSSKLATEELEALLKRLPKEINKRKLIGEVLFKIPKPESTFERHAIIEA